MTTSRWSQANTRRDGPADAAHPRRAARRCWRCAAVVARNDSAAAPATRGCPSRSALLHGAGGRGGRGGGRGAVPGRPAGRAEDRLVLRSAAEPRPRRRAGVRRPRAGRVLPYRRLRPALRRRRGGARSCWSIRSAPALAHAMEAAALNGLAARRDPPRATRSRRMAALAEAGERFDIVICDPPAFAKSRKDAAGRLARLRPHGAAGRQGGGAGRVPVHRLMQPSRAARRLGRADRAGAAPCPAGGAHPGQRRRRRTIRCIRICRRRPI